MYVEPNFKTKKALKEAVAKGETVIVFNPGLGGPIGPAGRGSVEGPHYPEPHRWYASVEWRDGKVIKVS